MKKYLFIISVTFLAGLFFSCNENEFLTEEPKDAIYAVNLYTSADGFENALNALYALVRKEYAEVEQPSGISFVRNAIWMIGTDNGISNYPIAQCGCYNKYGSYLNSGDANLYAIFTWLYQVVNSSNMIISRAQNPEVNWKGATPAASETVKNRIIGEAKLIRAWAYRHLTYTWGPVPLSLEEISGLNFRNDWERTPVADIRKVMEEDLLFAEQNLPDVPAKPYKVGKAVARHFLAELYLALGKNDLAEQKALAVCNGTSYKIVKARFGVAKAATGSTFSDLFLDGNVLASSGNTEVLWMFPNGLDKTGNEPVALRRSWNVSSRSPGIVYNSENGGRGIGRLAHTKWALDNYTDKNDERYIYGIRWYFTKPDGSKINMVTPTTDAENKATLPVIKKWEWAASDPARYSESFQYNDILYLRVADTYLLLAEAEFKLNKPTEAAFWINELRTRAKAAPVLPAEVTLDYILDERSRELLGEEHRRHTLVRTGKLIARTRLYNKLAGPLIADFNVLLPVPQPVIDANTGKKMEQNTGY